MKAWLPHAVFGAILVASLAANRRAADLLTEPVDIWPAVIRVVRSHRLPFHQETIMAGAPVHLLTFEAPGCARPATLALASVTFEHEAIARTLREQRLLVHYFYIDRIWTGPDRVAVLFEWEKHKVLALLGLTKYVPSRYMLLLGLPPDCRGVESIDWRVVWDRSFVTAAQAADAAAQ